MTESSIVNSRPYRGPNWAFDMGGWPPFWMSKAKELDRAANLILLSVYHDFAVFKNYIIEYRINPRTKRPNLEQPMLDIFYFLAALAIENLLKGLYIRSHPECISNGKLHGNIVTKHDLLKIANEINIPHNDNEILFLKYGKYAIESWGRYPITKNVEKWEGQRSISIRIADVYRNLFDRLLNDLKTNPFPKPS